MLYAERKDHERTIKELEKTKRLLRKYKKLSGRVKKEVFDNEFFAH